MPCVAPQGSCSSPCTPWLVTRSTGAPPERRSFAQCPWLLPLDDDRRLLGRREGVAADAGLAFRGRIELVLALDDLGGLRGERLRLAPERRREDLVHRVHE